MVVAAVPWARHKARFSRYFDDTVAWLATNCSKSAVQELMRISWRTSGRIIERVADEARERIDLLAGLRRIGIDEISYRKGHRYLTVVVDHDRRRLVWAAPGRDKATVHSFFDALGPECCTAIQEVSAECTGRVHEHEDPLDRSPCLRLPLSARSDCHGDAHTVGPVSASAGKMIHGKVRRAPFPPRQAHLVHLLGDRLRSLNASPRRKTIEQVRSDDRLLEIEGSTNQVAEVPAMSRAEKGLQLITWLEK